MKRKRPALKCTNILVIFFLLLNLITVFMGQIGNDTQMLLETNYPGHDSAPEERFMMASTSSTSKPYHHHLMESHLQYNPKFKRQPLHINKKFDPSIWTILEPSRFIPPQEQATQVGQGKFGCVRQTNHVRRHALMRVIVFQKDGQMQLQNLISHYIQALRFDEIVIINHNGNDAFTLEIIDKYAQLGVHVWNCNGTSAEVMYRDEIAKGQMWSDVISMYKSDSDFLLPVDVDEHLMLRMGAKAESPFDTGSYITWNRDDLIMALSELSTSGKIYKTVNATMTPYDCGIRKSHIRVNKAMASECFAKIFFRGSDFNGTDAGNHHGVPRDELFHKCRTYGVENVYEVTNFISVHHQVTCFSDWLIHTLRVANEKGYNDKMVNCSLQDSRTIEICELWDNFAMANFSVWDMKKLYQDHVCSLLHHDGKDEKGEDVFVVNYTIGDAKES
jgi:hypothetical protein